MSNQKIMIEVSSVISYIKERLEVDLKEASDKSLINIEKSEIEKLCTIAKASIDTSFFKSSDQIANSIK